MRREGKDRYRDGMYGLWRGSGGLNVLIQQEFRLLPACPGFQRLPCVSWWRARLATSLRGCGETPGGPDLESRAGPCGVVSLARWQEPVPVSP